MATKQTIFFHQTNLLYCNLQRAQQAYQTQHAKQSQHEASITQHHSHIDLIRVLFPSGDSTGICQTCNISCKGNQTFYKILILQ